MEGESKMGDNVSPLSVYKELSPDSSDSPERGTTVITVAMEYIRGLSRYIF
jgi:hypothetical protein